MRGRPSTPENDVKNKVLETSFSICINKDFSSISIDEIARNAGLAKKTIYKHFKNKDAIIEQMIEKWTSTKTLTAPSPPQNKEEVIDKLLCFFMELSAHALSLESVAIFRFLQSDAHKKNEYLKLYRENGINNASEVLNEWLYQVKQRGFINPLWPDNSASYFQALLITPHLRDITLGLKPPVPEYDLLPELKKTLLSFQNILLNK